MEKKEDQASHKPSHKQSHLKEDVQLLARPKKEIDFKAIQSTMSQIAFPAPDWAKEYRPVNEVCRTKTGSSS